jgi:speckle-type POZ protein
MEYKRTNLRMQKSLGKYQLVVENFSGLPDSDSIQSPDFSLNGNKWQLRIYPNGKDVATSGFVSCYLINKTNRDLRAKYKLTIVNQRSRNDDKSHASSGVYVFLALSEQFDSWGVDNLMLSKTLFNQESGFLVNDTIIFEAEVTCYGKLEEVPISQSTLLLPTLAISPSFSLSSSLKALWNDKETSDLTLLLGPQKERFYGHRCLLAARSEVFRVMFTSMMQETCKGELEIPDYEAEVIRQMLTYVYTDELPNEEFMSVCATSWLSIGVKYQIPGMISFGEDYFGNRLKVDNALTLLQMADGIGALRLRIRVMRFIMQYKSKILEANRLHDLSEELQREIQVVLGVMIENGNQVRNPPAYSTCIML